jgi:2-polyprenyl-6-methoxyphenol hydroxylase-like FAD-dependent oxidoreductase
VKTVVIGAGPAGLMFSLIGKILLGESWSLSLYDKREAYVRTHRLRVAPEPYRAIQAELGDARFDRLLAFLEEARFSPEVNLLEAKLSELLAELGVRREVREIDTETIDDLDADTIVGADSVHSTVREFVRGSVTPATQTHERVARLRVIGSDLPERLGVVDQFRLSKVLGSVVDYRVNKNGFAEMDLFLVEEEHAALGNLGASPKDPIEITPRMLAELKAPLFRAIVQHLARGDCKIMLQSTFRLEHQVMPRVSFERHGKRVFLVGDACASLPFFRGMACLASCAHALARAHADRGLDSYEREVEAIVAREVRVVRARAHAVRALRELIRISALLPFPIQSWWLSAARDPSPDRMSPGGWFNLLIAVTAGLAVLLGTISPWLVLPSLPIEIAGGIAYRWTLDLEPGPHRYVRAIWAVQITYIALSAGVLAMIARIPWASVFWWWVLGLGFALGIVLFERVVARRLRRAALE